MRSVALGSLELGEALKIRTQRRVNTVLSNGSDFPWFPEGFTFPMGIDKNDRPRHLCSEERVIHGVSLVFPVVFWDVGTYNNRGPASPFHPYWIEWQAIHDLMPLPDQREWRDGTMIEGVCAMAQAPEVGSLRCYDRSWIQASGQLYVQRDRVVANCGGSSSFHHRMLVRTRFCPEPPRGLITF